MAKTTKQAKARLEEYAAKREFNATPEPAPSESRPHRGPLLFVLQLHTARRLHYDLRLECDGVLKSWAVPKGPSLEPGEKRLAMRTEDHPFDYASFEGVIPPGQYGAGEVIVWDCGVYSPDEGGPVVFDDPEEAERRVREGVEKGKLSVQLRGEKLKGSFALVRMADAKSWLLLKHKDRFAGSGDATLHERSVLSACTVADLKTMRGHRFPAARLTPRGDLARMPEDLPPMQAESAGTAFDDPAWSWEPKLDGYRALAFLDGDGVRIRSRKGLELAAQFPRLASELEAQQTRMILDGEIVAFDATGKPSFGALQNYRQSNAGPVVFFCFDLLYFAGIDLRSYSYVDRRRYLVQCLMPSSLVQLVHVSDSGEELYRAAVASGLEGVVGKRKDSRYEAGRRSASWIKVKAVRSAEFVIGGYTRGKGSRDPLGALLVGYWDTHGLRYACNVGSGFDSETLAELTARLEPLTAPICPFAEKPAQAGRAARWVEPKLVAEVKFQDWTEDGSLRAPVFLRLRDDVDARSVRRQAERVGVTSRTSASSEVEEVVTQLASPKASFTLTVGAHRIKLTHLDRVYWPADAALKEKALTKRDLLRYLAQVSPYMLPHLADRPLTMIRMPDGIGGQRFFQKHWEQERPPFVDRITVFSGHKDESHEYLLCSNLPTLLWLAQSGTLEYHVWHSRARRGRDAPRAGIDYATSLASLEASILNFPDYVVFDIDPYIYSGKERAGEEPELNTIAFEKGKEVAFRVRELLRTMALDAIVKTSGKTGLHVFVPIKRSIDFNAARQVSELVGRHLMRLHPQDITLEWSIPKRTGKIFMDYNMNVRGKTLNVAYSPRGAPGAPVSMPLTWEELASAHPLDFRLTNAAERLARTGDRWSEALSCKQSLEDALDQART
jgi:bifunctional non-homologous end joining protein LigD